MFEISHTSPDRSVVALSGGEMQIGSDQWYHQRVAPASSLSAKHASRHICKQLTGPFSASLFLRGLEGWHAGADLNVPRLSLNLHVRCQLPCHRRSIAPTLTLNTPHALRKAVTSNLRKEKESSLRERRKERKKKKIRRNKYFCFISSAESCENIYAWMHLFKEANINKANL